MIYIPTTPAAGGPMLAAYIAAEPDRRVIFDHIQERLEPTGRVGDHARYYIVQRPQRRAVFRGILLCLRECLPAWSKDNAGAAAENRAFTEEHRASYAAYRKAALAADTAQREEAALAD